MKGEGIVGQPQVVVGALIVADVTGKFTALDPESGKPLGKEYAVKASVAPVATPVSFGEEDALVPLSDGTMLLLPVKSLCAAPAEPPKK